MDLQTSMDKKIWAEFLNACKNNDYSIIGGGQLLL